MNNIKIITIKDNNHQEHKVYSGLKPGDKLKAKVTIKGFGDLGMSGLVYELDSIIKDEIYTVDRNTFWKGTQISWVIDEDGCSIWPTPDLFDVI